LGIQLGKLDNALDEVNANGLDNASVAATGEAAATFSPKETNETESWKQPRQ
jgi:hypothetical protein